MRKTYAIRGLMEFQALIPAGRSTVRIPFTGGALSGYGVTPATFRTSDPTLQHLIEASPDFRKGRITLLRSEAASPAPTSAPAPASPLPAGGFSRPADQPPASPLPGGGFSRPADPAHVCADLSDAREYLAENCSCDRRRLKSADAIREAAREHGVIISDTPDRV